MNENEKTEPKKKIKKLILTGCTKIIEPYYTPPKTKDQRKIIIKLYNYYIREKNKTYSKKYMDTIFKLLYNNNGEKEIIDFRNKINFRNINKIKFDFNSTIKNLPYEMNLNNYFIKLPDNEFINNNVYRISNNIFQNMNQKRKFSAKENKIFIKNLQFVPSIKNKTISRNLNQIKYDGTSKNSFLKNRAQSCVNIFRKQDKAANIKKIKVIKIPSKTIKNEKEKKNFSKKIMMNSKSQDKIKIKRNNFTFFSIYKKAYEHFLNENNILGKINDKTRVSRLLLSSAVYVKKQKEHFLNQEMRRFNNLSLLNSKTTTLNHYPFIF